MPLEDNVDTIQDKKRIEQELSKTFTAELANMAYIAFSQLAGGLESISLLNSNVVQIACFLGF
jgi:hypothetical protein